MDNVKEIQVALRAAGLNPGELDGEWGPQTQAAVVAFQKIRGLDPDGIVGPMTRRALGLELQVRTGEPAWLPIARGYLGMKEIVGPYHNPEVVALWKKAHVPGVNDDETPWCSAFVSAVLEEAGVVSKRTGWARGYLKWGRSVGAACVGAVVVFERGPTSGHVGFVVGRDMLGNIMVLGGNQQNAVSIAPFARTRVLSYRYPNGLRPADFSLPVIDSDGRLSRDEA